MTLNYRNDPESIKVALYIYRRSLPFKNPSAQDQAKRNTQEETKQQRKKKPNTHKLHLFAKIFGLQFSYSGLHGIYVKLLF